MRSGRLRYSIEIQQTVETQSGSGSVINTWQTVTQTRASYEPISGKEMFTAEQDMAQITTRFRTRFVSGVKAKMRVLFDGRTFDIKSAIDVYGRGRELEILAVENV